jgi:hypothetical protein
MLSAIEFMSEGLQFKLFNDLCFLFLAYCLKSCIFIGLSDCLVSMVGDYGWMRESIMA